MSKILDYNAVLNVLPERPPVLMVDRVELDDGGAAARAVKCVSMDEAFFQGHFPAGPIMPGVLQVAGMVQTAKILAANVLGGDCTPGGLDLLALKRVKFRKPVLPGDVLTFEATVGEAGEDSSIELCTTASVEGGVASQGRVLLAPAEKGRSARVLHALYEPLPTSCSDQVSGQAMDFKQVMATIPHRFPFLLLDRVLGCDRAKGRVVGVKNVTGNEPFIAGAPFAAMPGYLQVEAAAQAACVLALSDPANQGKLGVFMAIDRAVFHVPVIPGDQLLMNLTMETRSRFGVARGTVQVGGTTVTECELKFALVDPE